eukprot:Polyplicarium_translucidae@DN3276_c0_g1_i4.p2
MFWQRRDPYGHPTDPEVTLFDLNVRPRWCYWWVCILVGIIPVAAAATHYILLYVACPSGPWEPVLKTWTFALALPVVVLPFWVAVCAVMPCVGGGCQDPYRAEVGKDNLVLQYAFHCVAIKFADVKSLKVVDAGRCDGCCCCCCRRRADIIKLVHYPAPGRTKAVELHPVCGARRMLDHCQGAMEAVTDLIRSPV